MTNLDVSNSSTDSSSGSTSDSSSSDSSSRTSRSGSSSSDSDSSTSEAPAVASITTPAESKSPAKQNNNEDSGNNKKKDEKEKSRRASTKTKPSSSSEEEPKAITEEIKVPPPRRRSSAKQKNAAPVNSKQNKPNSKLPTGAKTPKPTSKPAQKPPIKTETRASSKKKSIFSPDNSSESDTEVKTATAPKVQQKTSPKTAPILRAKGRKSSSDKVKPPSPEKQEEKNHKENNNVKRRSGSRSSGPPSKKAVDASSCTSSQTSSELDTHDSDSEQSPKKVVATKTEKIKSTPVSNKPTPKPPDTPTKPDELAVAVAAAAAVGGAVPRKLTRSLSARVSRLAAATKVTHTDSDSEPDDKHNDKIIDAMKKTGRKMMRSPIMPPTPPESFEPREKRCPVRGCDSVGHLGGTHERHFTFDACPLYHNVTPSWCVAASEERVAVSHTRRKAVQAMQQRPRSQPSIEQRAFQLKVKDMRSKWKGPDDRLKIIDDPLLDREPSLEGFAPDYDLRLFRDAQALAAINIEEELGDLPADRGTKYVVMGKYMMEVWYQSPYPGDAARVPRLFVCEFCLTHHKCKTGATRHATKCLWRHPPGDEVYRKENLSVWQVDGRKHKQYCQQLCLLAKFFLDHKTLYYDVEPFLFYVMTIADKEGCHIVGYFSKEKNSFLNYNVSCILTLPPYQRQGYGRLLIDFSYLLTKVEGKVGSPETPLSDLGLISYRSYWKEALLRRLCSAPGPALCVRDLSKDLAIASCDIVSTLQERGLMKYWKGKHIVLKKQEVLEEMSRRSERVRCVEAACLRWSPPAPPPPR